MSAAESTESNDGMEVADGLEATGRSEDTESVESSRSTAVAEGVGTPRPGRSIGTIGVGLLVMLGVVIVAVGVIPQPRWELWLVGVVAVLGLSLVLLVLAVLPRGRGSETVVSP